jgi:hypothetical protein
MSGVILLSFKQLHFIAVATIEHHPYADGLLNPGMLRMLLRVSDAKFFIWFNARSYSKMFQREVANGSKSHHMWLRDGTFCDSGPCVVIASTASPLATLE